MSGYWKIDGKTPTPGLMLGKLCDGRSELRIPHLESGAPDDDPVTLDVLVDNPGVALITAVDGRGTRDGSPAYSKFICHSFSKGENQHITTAYLIYLVDGPVWVHAWDDAKKSLLEKIDMLHVNVTPDRTPERVIQKHLERVKGKELLTEGLRDLAEKIYFDMIWNVPVHYCIWTG